MTTLNLPSSTARGWPALLLALLFTATSTLASDEVRLEVTRDTWVSSVGTEKDGNNGGATKLKTKGIQEFSLLDIDPAPLAGRVVTGATLHVRYATGEPQRRVTVSTLASEWHEGDGSGYAARPGSASFNWARQGQTPWAWPGSDITAVINGEGHTLWRFADATATDGGGWQRIAVDPEVVAARVAGISHGFVVFDDVGHEYQRDGNRFTHHVFPNRFLFSREAGAASAPFLTVQLGGIDREPPERVGVIASDPADLPAGESFVSWATPGDRGAAGVIGFDARLSADEALDWETSTPVERYLIPMAGAAGERVTMHLRDLPPGVWPGHPGAAVTIGIRAVDGAGNVGAVRMARVALSTRVPVTLGPAPVVPFDDDGSPLPRVAGVEVCVIDALDKVHPVSGATIPTQAEGYTRANHLWSTGNNVVRLHAARNEFVAFQIVLRGVAEAVGARIAFDVGEGGDGGGGDERSPRGRLYRFRHVASDAGPLPDPLVPLNNAFSIPSADENITGQRSASLLAEVYVPHTARPGVQRGRIVIVVDGEQMELPIELRVWDFALPDHLSFVPQMNCYSIGGGERAYYRLAHEHRTCLNRLPYNWRGRVAEGFAPALNDGVADWSAFDRRFGPLLDGSLFDDMPRRGVPVDAFYLPINENWPMEIERYFRGGYWADEAFEPRYREGIVRISRAFAQHVAQREWADTLFEFYLNNKIAHKVDGWDRSSALWILDEPVNTQDFWALRWYGRAFQEGVSPHRAGIKMAFRADISRPQWQRDTLDGVLGVNVVGGAVGRYQRMVNTRKRRHGEIVYWYGTSNAIEASNVQPAAWCIDAWSGGADGVIPWQTMGKEKSWSRADALAMFYPPTSAGDLPAASVRLKAYRRGQQDVEYLTILSEVLNQPQWAVAAAAREAVGLRATFSQHGAEDAGVVDYGPLTPAALWSLRVRVGAMIDAARPADRRRWVKLTTPIRDGAGVKELGLVRGREEAARRAP